MAAGNVQATITRTTGIEGAKQSQAYFGLVNNLLTLGTYLPPSPPGSSQTITLAVADQAAAIAAGDAMIIAAGFVGSLMAV